MTIERGRGWGSEGRLPPDAVVVADAELGPLLDDTLGSEVPPPVVIVTLGDLARSLGARRQPAVGDEVTLLPVDVGRAVLDGRVHHFAAHLVVRRAGWRGRVVAVMNAQHLGAWDVAPRAHPGDGAFEVLDGRLDLLDRLKARSRLPSGTHVPHPAIAQRRVHDLTIEVDRPTRVWLDGVAVGRARRIGVQLLDGALTVAV